MAAFYQRKNGVSSELSIPASVFKKTAVSIRQSMARHNPKRTFVVAFLAVGFVVVTVVATVVVVMKTRNDVSGLQDRLDTATIVSVPQVIWGPVTQPRPHQSSETVSPTPTVRWKAESKTEWATPTIATAPVAPTATVSSTSSLTKSSTASTTDAPAAVPTTTTTTTTTATTTKKTTTTAAAAAAAAPTTSRSTLASSRATVSSAVRVSTGSIPHAKLIEKWKSFLNTDLEDCDCEECSSDLRSWFSKLAGTAPRKMDSFPSENYLMLFFVTTSNQEVCVVIQQTDSARDKARQGANDCEYDLSVLPEYYTRILPDLSLAQQAEYELPSLLWTEGRHCKVLARVKQCKKMPKDTFFGRCK